MAYSEAQKKATLTYKKKNIERTRELARKHSSNYYLTHHEKELNRMKNYRDKKRELKLFMNILIDEII
jgi:hypothetical protein